MGRQHRTTTLAEAYATKALALAITAQDHAIAIFKKGSLLAVGQGNGVLAALAEFEQRATLVWSRPRQRARPKKIPTAQVASVDGVVRHQLCHGPIGVTVV